MNTRKTILATLLAALAVTPLAVTPVHAQVHAQAAHTYTQAELDQMLAPIALYPDALLSQVLMAATYPIEVVEAARWSRAHPGLQGDDAVRAVQDEDWDPSVKSLVAFPQILQRMDEKLEWTRTLGDAFLAQEPQVMDQVQLLRRRAQSAGHLQSSEQIRVEHQGPTIIVRQASPEYIYVPYYDPMEVYGTWLWPAYRPVAWAPWPGYVRPYHRPGVSIGFWWGRPVGLSLGFFFGDFDWNRRHTHVAHSNSYYYRAPAYSYRSVTAERGRWQHDPQHRRAVAYRTSEERRDERQLERRTDRRENRREDRQAARQAQPAATVQAQPQAVTPTQRAERREDRRAERQAAMEAQRQARQQAQDGQRQAQQQQARQQAQDAQRQAQQQARQQAQETQRQAQQQARQPQPAATMPAAQAPQTPRAARQEQREERREKRREQREEKG